MFTTPCRGHDIGVVHPSQVWPRKRCVRIYVGCWASVFQIIFLTRYFDLGNKFAQLSILFGRSLARRDLDRRKVFMKRGENTEMTFLCKFLVTRLPVGQR